LTLNATFAFFAHAICRNMTKYWRTSKEKSIRELMWYLDYNHQYCNNSM